MHFRTIYVSTSTYPSTQKMFIFLKNKFVEIGGLEKEAFHGEFVNM